MSLTSSGQAGRLKSQEGWIYSSSLNAVYRQNSPLGGPRAFSPKAFNWFDKAHPH